MTYNIHHGADVTGKLISDKVIEMPMLISSDFRSTATLAAIGLSRPACYAGRLKMHYVYGSPKVYNLEQDGNRVLWQKDLKPLPHQ